MNKRPGYFNKVKNIASGDIFRFKLDDKETVMD